MKTLLVLGSTGSIGTQTLDLVRSSPGEFRVAGLTAGANARLLLAQAHAFRPSVVALADPAAAEAIRSQLPPGTALRVGPGAAEELAAELDYDLAVHGIVGAIGVWPSVRVLERGRTLALANKESMVVAGAHLMELARRTGGTIVPVDSEHSAIFQCLRGESIQRVRSIWLTASGGPFRDLPLERLAEVTPAEALVHPNWDMGPRISIGSATLMNKALEIVEAHHLFGLPAEKIRVILHRQSLVHSLVEFVDGSLIAQMGPPDMRMPIHFALHHPDRARSDLVGMDLGRFRELSFAEVDLDRFPALELGYRCVREEKDSGAVLNAADEVAVAAFLAGSIGFRDIFDIDRAVLDAKSGENGSIAALLRSDGEARARAKGEIDRRARVRGTPVR